MKERMERLKKESGTIVYSDALTSFLYELMRDHLPAGEVEAIVNNSINSGPTTYTNGWLAQYAFNLAEELRNAQTNQLAEVLENALAFGNENKKEPSEKRPSFKVQEVKKLKDELVKEVTEGEESPPDDYGLSLVEQLELTGQLPKEEADRIRKEIEEVKKQNEEKLELKTEATAIITEGEKK